ncbi:precorrin-4 C(11)-methyltransferase [Isachenkonia alkalipeptolytica]|uniref:Precorrin-4 C(11)-methyltransferase n=1 Tax=Isachenkonia alkalipeptolytica TaxID=2565777 RepID=A0AA44BCN3_9CLOT|nr:precorrin-4 C(11)-methyltransferase [Isachenkonia alkalipeptolytica]NBG87088.1 precorrin-4 C(11)-methyltransferase [Isachenkonia alkalipeptolytica]
MKTVYFVGAGPGDPELITVKGQNLVKEGDIIIYAGSLVNEKILDCKKKDAKLYNSASMTLDEVLEVTERSLAKGEMVVRVHTGDPTIYGAIKEQIDALEEKGIRSVVIPGVSSFTASAASLNRELTLPGVSQTVILTRLEGRTPVPELEKLESLARHQSTMAIFLSVQMIDRVVEKLRTHYPEDTPIAVVQRATWEDQKQVIGTLGEIGEKVKEAKISKTAQILVGRFLGEEYELSKLYDPKFTHEYREAKR